MSDDLTRLKARFDDAMMEVYRRALDECDYKATRFLQMLHDHRGLETAQILLHASNVSEGYVALWERRRLDLTVEAVILVEEWHPLFSEQEREIARKRLAEYGYTPKRSFNSMKGSEMSGQRIITASLEGMRVLVDEKQCELQEYNFASNQWISKDTASWPLTRSLADIWLTGWNDVDRFAAVSTLTGPSAYRAEPRGKSRGLGEPRL